MNSQPSAPSGPYAWWLSFPIATREAIRSALVSTAWTSATVFFTLYSAYTPPPGENATLHGFLAFLPGHWFGALVGLAAIAYRTHAGFNRATNPTEVTIPNPNAK